jgi:hypothetical protein
MHPASIGRRRPLSNRMSRPLAKPKIMEWFVAGAASCYFNHAIESNRVHMQFRSCSILQKMKFLIRPYPEANSFTLRRISAVDARH